MKNKYKCLLLVRISTTKQLRESDSPEHQMARGYACAARHGFTQEEVLVIHEAYSGRKEDRPMLDQALDLATSMVLKKLFIFDIDRLTRAGPAHYERIKRGFAEIGCEIIDVKGVIQPDQNTLEGSGGAFGKDFAYDWSVFAPSETAEMLAAQTAKDEARKILSRTMPIQIKNAQLGRTNRQAPYGYKNIKIIDESGKPQPSKEIYEPEAFFVRRIFEGIAAGRDVRCVCDEVNALGFKSRETKKWNREKSQVIGKIGGIPISPFTLREMIARPVYAGFIVEKWTHGIPVEANHEAIVSLDLWNQANKGKWQIIRSTDTETGWELLNIKTSPLRRSYHRERPEFPFKSLMTCSVCGKPYKGSFSRSENGSRIGYYHCNRGHKQISARVEKLHTWLGHYLSELAFTPEMAERFEQHIRSVWVEKVGGMNKQLASSNQELADLRAEADGIFESIKVASNPIIIRRLENDYEDLHQRIKLLEGNRDCKELTEADMNRAIKWARKLVERLDELIIDAQDERIRGIFWSLVFCTHPTIEQIENRTADISPLVRLKSELETSEIGVVPQTMFRSNFLVEELERWENTFSLMPDTFQEVFGDNPDGNCYSLPKAA